MDGSERSDWNSGEDNQYSKKNCKLTNSKKKVIFRIPKNLRFSVEHTQTCIDSSCIQTYIEAKHCNGLEYVAWTRFGDGLEILQERVAGGGCDV